ncbi:MAG: response regulator [Bdellovibrionia bacterium]
MFNVNLPESPPELASAGDISGDSCSGKISPSIRILVIDDSEFNLLLLDRTLKKYGHIVTTVKSGEGALALVAQKNVMKGTAFDLIFMDYDMGVQCLTGVDTVKEIRRMGQIIQPKIIGYSSEEQSNQLLSLIGADTTLLKPANRNEILEMIAELT